MKDLFAIQTKIVNIQEKMKAVQLSDVAEEIIHVDNVDEGGSSSCGDVEMLISSRSSVDESVNVNSAMRGGARNVLSRLQVEEREDGAVEVSVNINFLLNQQKNRQSSRGRKDFYACSSKNWVAGKKRNEAIIAVKGSRKRDLTGRNTLQRATATLRNSDDFPTDSRSSHLIMDFVTAN